MSALSPALGVILRSRRYLLRDSFSRPYNASSLGTADAGGAWTVGNAADATLPTWGLSGGQAYLPAAGGVDPHAWLESNRSDGILEALISVDTAASTNQQGLIFRRASTGNYILARLSNAADTVALLENVAGVRNTVDSASVTIADGSTRRLRVRLNGPLIRVYVDGVLLITYQSTAHQTATKHGLYTSGGGAFRAADFRFWTAA